MRLAGLIARFFAPRIGEYDRPFLPVSPTVAIASDVTAPLGVRLGESPTLGMCTALIFNSGANTSAVAFASTAALAQTNAAIPAAGASSQPGVLIIGTGVTLKITVPAGMFWSSINGTGAQSVFVTIGQGL